MDPMRFDRFAKAVSARFSRRTALQVGGAVGLLGATAGLSSGPSQAQEASSAATPASDGQAARFLYIQTFAGGSLAPSAAKPGWLQLTLTGAPEWTVAFADHPSRKTDALLTANLPEALAFAPANPPNAALVIRPDDREEVVLILELLEPAFDDAARTLTYFVRDTGDYTTIGTNFTERAQSLDSTPTSFGISSLFIDSGSDAGSCSPNLTVCSSAADCCPGYICVSATCNIDDPSQTQWAAQGSNICALPSS